MLLPIMLKIEHEKSDEFVSADQIPYVVVIFFILAALHFIVIILLQS